MSKLPVEALSYYIGLGDDRSYASVAEHYGVSKAAVAKRARRDRWTDRAREIQEKVVATSVQKAVETLEEMNERHLKIIKVIQGKAIEALRAMPLTRAIDAVRALDKAIAHERLIRGEPTERTAVSVEEATRTEFARWMTVEGEDDAAVKQDGVLP